LPAMLSTRKGTCSKVSLLASMRKKQQHFDSVTREILPFEN